MARGARPPRTIVFYGFSILGEVMTKASSLPSRRSGRHGPASEWSSSAPLPARARSATSSSWACRRTWRCCPWSWMRSNSPRPASSLGKLAGAARTRRGQPHAFCHPGQERQPEGIRDFADLARPGVKLVHPDPLTSGGANWAIVAEYGAGVRQSGGNADAGRELLLGHLGERGRAGALRARGAHAVRKRVR